MTMNDNKNTDIINYSTQMDNSTQMYCEECSPNNNANNNSCRLLLPLFLFLLVFYLACGLAVVGSPILLDFIGYILLLFFVIPIFAVFLSWGVLVILSPFVFGNDLIETEQSYRALGSTTQAYLVEKKIVKSDGSTYVEHTFQYTSPENGCTYQNTHHKTSTFTVLVLPASPEMAKTEEDFLPESQFYFWLAPFLFWIKFKYYYHYKRSSSSPSYAVMLTAFLSGCWWHFFISDFIYSLEDPHNSFFLIFNPLNTIEEMSPMGIVLLHFALMAIRVIFVLVILHFGFDVNGLDISNKRWKKVCPLHGVKEPLPLEEDQELVILEKERELVQLD